MLAKIRKRILDRKGFTIPELLIVMFVITALVAGAVVGLRVIKAKGQITKTMKDVDAIFNAMTAFNNDLGVWPRDKDGILDLIQAPPNNTYTGVDQNLWRGPYLQMSFSNNGGYPLNAFGGFYMTRWACSNNVCEYGVIVTNVPQKRAEDLDLKIDGKIDANNGNCRYSSGAPYNGYASPYANRVNVFIKMGEE